MPKLLLLLSLLALSVSARAEWRESSSAHFVVYADTSESTLRTFSERLERYNAAMAAITGIDDQVPSASNRVTIYVVDGVAQVQKLANAKRSSNLGGFYVPRAGGSLAIIPSVQGAGASGDLDSSMATLLHEYAHHFLISNSNFPSPRWLSEGAAEFYASASFEKDGAVGLGRPALLRGPELYYARDVTVEDLLDPEVYAKRRGKSTAHDAFYGRAWLLYHYLVLGGKRPGQLVTYRRALFEGKPLREAAEIAFGDFKVLEKEIDAYLNQRRLKYVQIEAAKLSTGPVSIRVLRPGEAAIMPVRIRSRVGVNKDTAPLALADARAVAARFPGDPAVQAALAEAEYDAGNDKEAIAAADAALKSDPNQVNAYLQKGYALLHIAEAGGGPKAFSVAREPFLALNKIENDHPLALFNFYLSFVKQGVKPSANAVAALERASVLAPFDHGLRMTAAMQLLRDGKPDLARAFLLPVAYNPHGGGLAATARKALERLDQDPKWDGSDLQEAEESDEE